MTKQILKTVFAGVLGGVVVFMMPFIIIKVLIFFLLIKAIFRLMGGGRRRAHMRYAYAHKFQNMSEEERATFMQKHGSGCCGWNSKCETTEFDATENKDKTSGV